jgi:MFS family permease
VLYGLDWFATGPSTAAIIAKHFGQDRVGMLFGLVFVSHQIGSAIAALGAGWIYSHFGEYYYAFLSGAVMGLLAAGMALVIRRDLDQAPAMPASAEAARAKARCTRNFKLQISDLKTLRHTDHGAWNRCASEVTAVLSYRLVSQPFHLLGVLALDAQESGDGGAFG